MSASARTLALAALVAASTAAQITPFTGNVGGGGGPFDVLFINGSSGGANRVVEVGINKPITLDVTPNGTVTPGAGFAIFGFLGTPGPSEVTPLPFGVGTMAIPPCPLAPSNPLLLTLVDNFGFGCAPLLPATPAPWTISFPTGLAFPITACLQGVIVDPAGTPAAGQNFSVTNAVTLKVIDDRLQVLYSKITGHPTALVPGATDSAGNPVTTEFRAFEQLVGSPDGTRWMLRGRTQQTASGNETMMMTGAGPTGSVYAQMGRPIIGGAPGEVYDFFGSGLGRFNDNNDFAFSARAMGGAASIFQKVIRVVGGVQTIPFAMGSPLTGLVDIPTNTQGDETFGNSVGSIHLLNNLVIGSHDTTIGNISSLRRPAIFYDQAAFHQINVTSVIGLNAGPAVTWLAMDANTFYTTPNGLHWGMTGRIVGPPTTSDGVFVYDGQVRMQEGIVVPGGTVTPTTFLGFNLTGSHWYVRGAQGATGTYACKDGVIVAKTGDPIVPASSETWSTATFSAFVGNRNGDWVVCGQTNGAAATNDVIVLNGNIEVAREGDPVDLNGNGLFDDDCFLGRGVNTNSAFSPDNVFLTDDGWIYLFINLRNGAGADLNSNPVFSTPLAFLRKRIPH